MSLIWCFAGEAALSWIENIKAKMHCLACHCLFVCAIFKRLLLWYNLLLLWNALKFPAQNVSATFSSSQDIPLCHSHMQTFFFFEIVDQIKIKIYLQLLSLFFYSHKPFPIMRWKTFLNSSQAIDFYVVLIRVLFLSIFHPFGKVILF